MSACVSRCTRPTEGARHRCDTGGRRRAAMLSATLVDHDPHASRLYCRLPHHVVRSRSVFRVIFVAELGDKSQLMAMAFAARFKALPVLVGITIATAATHAISVGLGLVLGAQLPTDTIAVIAAWPFCCSRPGLFVAIPSMTTRSQPPNAPPGTPWSRRAPRSFWPNWVTRPCSHDHVGHQGRSVGHLHRVHPWHGRR